MVGLSTTESTTPAVICGCAGPVCVTETKHAMCAVGGSRVRSKEVWACSRCCRYRDGATRPLQLQLLRNNITIVWHRHPVNHDKCIWAGKRVRYPRTEVLRTDRYGNGARNLTSQRERSCIFVQLRATNSDVSGCTLPNILLKNLGCTCVPCRLWLCSLQPKLMTAHTLIQHGWNTF